ncbi:hypothetical protein NKI98_29865 [Mesorhizobium sp. M0222]|uniref:hypothetical protein n=1 Tax=Mesorhizobium sp. M0222 TaxID=2956921 RepID=UPI00333B0631
MREMIGNIKKVKPRIGSALMAYAFCRRRCKAFRSDGDALVRTGPAGHQLDCIDAVHSGVHHLTMRMRYDSSPFRSWT